MSELSNRELLIDFSCAKDLKERVEDYNIQIKLERPIVTELASEVRELVINRAQTLVRNNHKRILEKGVRLTDTEVANRILQDLNETGPVTRVYPEFKATSVKVKQLKLTNKRKG